MNKKKFGQYFTPRVIADFMVSLIAHGKGAKVLEPSCGEGVFLKSLLNVGFTDLDAYEIDGNLGNDFDFVQHKSFVSCNEKQEYDVVIGNPPYIRWKNLEEPLKRELNYSMLWGKYFNSLCDYLFIFILKSAIMLKENGELIFICSDYWMNTTHSINLRNFLLRQGYFTDIYRFKEAKIFPGVTASLVVFRYIKSSKKVKNKSIQFFEYIGHDLPTKEELATRNCFVMKEIPNFEENRRWQFVSNDTKSFLEKIQLICQKSDNDLFLRDYKKISDVCDIGNGMVSGLDKVFCTENISSMTSCEYEQTIRVFKAKDLVPFFNISEHRYVFIESNDTAEEICKKYPNLYQHFCKHKDELLKRYCYGKELPLWKFAFPRNEILFKNGGARIFVPCKERISKHRNFRFSYAPEDVFPLQDVTCLIPKKTCRESIYYLLGYLNSEPIFEWIKNNGIVKGDIVEFSEAPLAGIPFRSINWNSPRDVELHENLTTLVKDCVHKKNLKIEEINTTIRKLFQI